ncbi:hypothetical protein BKA70DRAFT_1330785 [Coprinopsis sp. MPI-PUGE-AT-0042]|nr:hypothetical protein BKA70DRAFT_1330785 [Coprinopsis sp. MPI-PUGE-AT-0042]
MRMTSLMAILLFHLLCNARVLNCGDASQACGRQARVYPFRVGSRRVWLADRYHQTWHSCFQTSRRRLQLCYLPSFCQ